MKYCSNSEIRKYFYEARNSFATEEKYNIVCQPQEVMDNPYYLGFKSLNYLNKPNNFSNPTQLHFNFKDIKEICKH